MAIHACVLGRVLSCTNPVGYTNLCHTTMSHARV
ncbi:hypothetical protein F383_28100 [Gossypium arboreum]|uniref:Uncharacterized protein n=1 Tax=Gossypium arboreum TaxID=29729 RepID=A0A0B0PAF0_GOSAR|nr:hypothetical protein F383_28100 [Gossypium arboreum]